MKFRDSIIAKFPTLSTTRLCSSTPNRLINTEKQFKITFRWLSLLSHLLLERTVARTVERTDSAWSHGFLKILAIVPATIILRSKDISANRYQQRISRTERLTFDRLGQVLQDRWSQCLEMRQGQKRIHNLWKNVRLVDPRNQPFGYLGANLAVFEISERIRNSLLIAWLEYI